VTAGTDTLADGGADPAVRGMDPFTGKPTAAAAGAGTRPRGRERHVADPRSRSRNPDLHPHDVAHDARPRVGGADAAAGGPLPATSTCPQIQVATFYTGAGPVDVEKSITVPIERAVSAAPGVDRVESVSSRASPAVTVWFQYGVNLDNAQFEVQQRVAQILNTLPPGIDQPFIVKFDVSNIPVAFAP